MPAAAQPSPQAGTCRPVLFYVLLGHGPPFHDNIFASLIFAGMGEEAMCPMGPAVHSGKFTGAD